MSDSNIYQTQVDLDGLFDVLAKNLYSTPSVAIRELIQNAHDACSRRKLESDASEQPDYAISVRCNEAKKTLTIEDNGSGLTNSEIQSYLATIGSGYTRLLREQTQTEEMIGYFGLGFLSAYVIADKVEVISTSFQTPEETWHFISRGGHQYSLQKSTKSEGEIGSKVVLHLGEEYAYFANVEFVRALVEKYCCLIDLPIYIGQDEAPANEIDIPWLLSDTTSELRLQKKILEFSTVFEDSYTPLLACEIPNNNPFGAKGVIWIQDASGYSTSDFRNVSIFVRKMFITQLQKDLLPKWAGFMGCVVECNALTPTASREDVQQDEHFDALQRYLLDVIIDWLKGLAKGQSEKWRPIQRRHNQALLAAALCDDELFHSLSDSLFVPTSMGDMTVKNIAMANQNAIAIRLDDNNTYEDIIYRAKQVPVVKGHMFAALPFCHKFAEIHGYKVHTLGHADDARSLFPSVATEPAISSALAHVFSSANRQVTLTKFEPEFLPVIIVENAEVKIKQAVEEDEADKRIGSAALHLARLHTKKIKDDIAEYAYINLDNPIIQKLPSLSDDRQESVAKLILATVSLINMHGNTEDFNHCLKTLSLSLLTVIEGAK